MWLLYESTRRSQSRPTSASSTTSTSTDESFAMLLMLILFRIANTFLVQTYFNPDEFWQGPEVAHRMTYGVGHLTWEWSPKAQLRSAVHPTLFAAFYWLVQLLGVDTRFVVAHGPRVLQSILAAVGDRYVYHWSLKLFGGRQNAANGDAGSGGAGSGSAGSSGSGASAAQWSLFCTLISFFNFFCITRTFSNSAETVLTVIALYYWPTTSAREQRNNSDDVASVKKYDLGVSQRSSSIQTQSLSSSQHVDSWWWSLSFAAAAVMLRPTSVLVWIPMGLRSLWHERTTSSRISILSKVCVVSMVAVSIWLTIDTLFYGEVTFVLWNFVSFNVVSGLDKLYGSHPWHWYLTQGCVVVFGTGLPLSAYGFHLVLRGRSHSGGDGGEFFKANQILKRNAASLLLVIVIVMFALSCTAHKEFRFILPLLPIIHVFSGLGLQRLSSSLSTTYFRTVVLSVVAINVVAAFVLSLVHQRGTIDVIHHIASLDDVTSVHFWTPCHATPYTSYLHHLHPLQHPQHLQHPQIGSSGSSGRSSSRLRQLDCSPPTMRSNWCGTHACNPLMSELLPNRGMSQSKIFEQEPRRTLDYLYKDVLREKKKKGEEEKEEENNKDRDTLLHPTTYPEFDEDGNLVVQWNWNENDIPSHVVIFDSEETKEVVSFLIEEFHCVRLRDFFHSFAQGDMHANRMRSRVALWSCGT